MLGRDIKTTRAALLKGVKNLRSQVQSSITTSLPWPQVCRAACQACAEVFLSLGKAMEAEVEGLVKELLTRAADTNKFIR